MHERQGIREAVVAALIGTAPTYATAAQARVTKTRMAPSKTAQLPAISVYTSDEAVNPPSANTAPRELKRRVTVGIEAWVIASADVDDALDAIALQVETAMDVDSWLGGTVTDSVLLTTEMGLKLDGERPMGCVRLEYAADYFTDLRVAEPADAFTTVDVQTSINNAQAPADRAEDLITGIHE